MSPMRAAVGFDDAEFVAALESYQRNVQDPRVMFDQVVEYLADKEKRVWQTEGRSAGTPWPAAGARSRRGKAVGSKKAKKKRVRRSHELMVLTGRLRRSMTQTKGTGGIRRKTRSQLTFGTRLKVANLHQQDQHPNKGRLPQRKLLHITETDVRNEIALVRAHIVGSSAANHRGRPL
jgi:hypothetical protein